MAKSSSTLFMVTQYDEYFDIKKTIQSLDEKAWKYAVGKHDKDGDKLHYHIVIQTPTSTTLDSIANTCGVEAQYVEFGRTSVKFMCGYLTHANDQTKVQYSYDEAVTIDKLNARKYIAEVKEYAQLSINPILEKIDKGEIWEYNLFDYITQAQYVKYHLSFKKAFEYQDKKHRDINRDMEVLFVKGKAGSGKTSFAKIYALQCGYTPYITSNGKNPFDDYAGQECVILDDCRPSDFKFNDFLKLLDNNTASLVGCRYYNKSFWRCKMLIITSTLDIDEWYSHLQESDKEASEQLTRRITDFITITKFDSKNGIIFACEESSKSVFMVQIANYKPPVKKHSLSNFFQPAFNPEKRHSDPEFLEWCEKNNHRPTEPWYRSFKGVTACEDPDDLF